MSNDKVIYTIEARGNVAFEVMVRHQQLDVAATFDAIHKSFDDCLKDLKSIGVNYEHLKTALVPATDKKEIAFVFDSTMASAAYGDEAFIRMIPLLGNESCSSVLRGDLLILRPDVDEYLRQIFMRDLIRSSEIPYTTARQFYVVYLNNLSDSRVAQLHQGLQPYQAYCGYFDLTFDSFLKSYLSTILVNCFIKCRNNIIQPYEETLDKTNVYGLPFELQGFRCKAVQEIYYGVFLSYKIERMVVPPFETDTRFALNALSERIVDLEDFTLELEEDKLGYLLTKKKDNMERAGIERLTRAEIEELIRSKLKHNYIYNLARKDMGTLKFNIVIETERADKTGPVKLLVALEFIPDAKKLRVITMY